MLLVTGGAGFIGSNFVLSTIAETGETLVNLDKLTYAGNLRNLDSLREDRRHTFVQGDICDREMVRKLLLKHKPRAVLHFAAESHVDRSIAGPAAFVQTNVVGTFCLLEETRSYYESLQQLRSVPVPGEADPADDPQCPGGQAAAGLRRRKERARLAVRARSLRRGAARARARQDRGNLQHRREQREGQQRGP